MFSCNRMDRNIIYYNCNSFYLTGFYAETAEISSALF